MQDEKANTDLVRVAGELLPLSVAAHVAYAEFTKEARQLPSGEPLDLDAFCIRHTDFHMALDNLQAKSIFLRKP